MPTPAGSSRARRRRALLFALQCIPLFVGCLLLYPHVVPSYQRLVVAVADGCLRHLPPPMHLAIGPTGYWNGSTIAPDGTESFFWGRPPENLHLFFMGLALLPALLLATPSRLPKRLRVAGLGMLLLFVSHVLAAIALVHAQYHLRVLTPDSVFWDWVKTIANAFGQVITFVLWGLLTWDVWLAEDGGRAASESD